MKATVFVFLLCISASLALRMKREPDHDHDDHAHDHDHSPEGHGHDNHDDENKIDSADEDHSNSSSHDDHHGHHDHHHAMHDSLDNLWARWNNLQSSLCGPQPGDAAALISIHNMKHADNGKAKWMHGEWHQSEVTTKSEDLGSTERAIYSGGHKLLEGDAIIPWFRMTKSAVLLFWHKGSNLLVHSISPNGTHNEVLVGDELADKHANFDAVFSPNTWLAVEIDGHDDGNYALFTSVLVPGYQHEYKEKGTEDLVSLVGEKHASMVKRLLPGAEDAATEHDHETHEHGQHDH